MTNRDCGHYGIECRCTPISRDCAYCKLEGEVERLRAFVAAFDEWQAAPTSENRDVLEQALWLYEKMLAAREAVGAIPPTAPPHTPKT